MRQEIILIFALMMLSPVVFYFVIDKKDDSALVGQRKKSEETSIVVESEENGGRREFEIGYSSARINPKSIRGSLGADTALDSQADSSPVPTSDPLSQQANEEVSHERESNSEADWLALYARWELNLLDATTGKTNLEDFGSEATCSLFFTAGGVTTNFKELKGTSISASSSSLTIRSSSDRFELSGLKGVSALAKATRTLSDYCSENG